MSRHVRFAPTSSRVRRWPKPVLQIMLAAVAPLMVGCPQVQSGSIKVPPSLFTSRGIVAIISEDSSGVPSKGTRGVLGTLQNVALSQDGRYAAFATFPAGLISAEAQFPEVYWHDSCLGAASCNPKTVLASAMNANPGGAPQEGNGQSYGPTISTDGQFVAFVSQATNLVSKRYPITHQHIYIRNTCLGGLATNCTLFTGMADINSDDSAELNSSVYVGRYDMDAGDHIAFSTDASNVVPSVPIAGLTYVEETFCTRAAVGPTPCPPKIWITSRDSGGRVDQLFGGLAPVLNAQSLLMASWPAGAVGTEVFVQGTCIGGPDGQSCIDTGSASPPAPVWKEASVDNSGNPRSRYALPPYSISANGRFVVFASPDALAPHSTQHSVGDGKFNIFVRDTCQEAPPGASTNAVRKACDTPSTETISVADDLSSANDLSTISNHAISADGRFVVFTSRASNLAQGQPPPNQSGVFVRDTCHNAPASCQPSTALVSVDSNGAFVQALEGGAVISGDGHYCAFTAFLKKNGTTSTQIVLASTGF